MARIFQQNISRLFYFSIIYLGAPVHLPIDRQTERREEGKEAKNIA